MYFVPRRSGCSSCCVRLCLHSVSLRLLISAVSQSAELSEDMHEFMLADVPFGALHYSRHRRIRHIQRTARQPLKRSRGALHLVCSCLRPCLKRRWRKATVHSYLAKYASEVLGNTPASKPASTGMCRVGRFSFADSQHGRVTGSITVLGRVPSVYGF